MQKKHLVSSYLAEEMVAFENLVQSEGFKKHFLCTYASFLVLLTSDKVTCLGAEQKGTSNQLEEYPVRQVEVN